MSLLARLQDAYQGTENFGGRNFIPYDVARAIVTMDQIDEWSKTHPLCQGHRCEDSHKIHLLHQILGRNLLVFVVLVFANLEFLICKLMERGSGDAILFHHEYFEKICQRASLSTEQKQELIKYRKYVGVMLGGRGVQNVPEDCVLPYLKREDLMKAGASGVLYKVKLPGGHVLNHHKTALYAEKRIRQDTTPNQDREKSLFHEVRTLQAAKHPHVIILLAAFTSITIESGYRVYSLHLLFPLAETDLAHWMVANQIPSNIANFSRQERQKYLYRSISGLVSGISYLHKEIDGRVITHHDLKPLNILIVDDKLQIADFGHSRLRPVIEGSATEGRLGTYEYQPPEYYNQDGSRAQGKYGRAFDVWAVGCIIIELATLIVHDWQSEMVNIFREERKSNSSRERESPTDIDQNLDFSFHNNLNVVTHWLSCLKQDGESRQLDEVLNIANGMLASKPENRLKMWEVSMDLHETMKKYDKEFIPNLEGLCEEPPRGREETIYTFDCDVPGWVTYTGEGIENRSETPLHRAAKNNNRLRTIRLWELGWPLSLRDANGETSLEIMKRSYDTELQKLEDNVISMIEAAGAGNIEEVKRLFSRGLSRLMVNAHGRSAMFEAVRCSQIYVVDYLLESEVKEQLMLPDRRSCYLPLHMAAATGVVNVLERLLKHYSDVNIFDQRGHTALFCAVSASHTDAVRLLIKNKAQLMPLINNHKRSISSPLHQALDLCEDSEVVEIVKLLLEAEDYRKCLDELDLDKTPLMIAAERGSVDCFELLFKAGASIHGYSSNKTTLLHKIIEHDQLDILRQYIHHFSSEDFRLHNIHGETPLQAAQGAKHKEIPRLLKSRMAQLSIFDKKESRVSAFLRNTKDIFAEVFCIPSNEGRNQLSEAREREYHR